MSEQRVAVVSGASRGIGKAIALSLAAHDHFQGAAAAQTAFGGIDVVVNSAGRLSLSPIADLDLDELDALHRTNYGPYAASKGAVEAMTLVSSSSPGPPAGSAGSRPWPWHGPGTPSSPG